MTATRHTAAEQFNNHFQDAEASAARHPTHRHACPPPTPPSPPPQVPYVPLLLTATMMVHNLQAASAAAPPPPAPLPPPMAAAPEAGDESLPALARALRRHDAPMATPTTLTAPMATPTTHKDY